MIMLMIIASNACVRRKQSLRLPAPRPDDGGRHSIECIKI